MPCQLPLGLKGSEAQGLAALSRFALYQPDSGTFSTFEPVCGASIR